MIVQECLYVFKYLVFHTVSMPMCWVYIHFIAHSHQVPVHLITHPHVQTIQIGIHITINGCIDRKAHVYGNFKDISLDEAAKTSSHLSKWCSSFFVYLTMHLVALYKGFIILQVCAGVPDVCPDVFIQIPGIITVIISKYYQK